MTTTHANARATYETEYGTTAVGPYRPGDGRRVDTYTSRGTGATERYLVFVAAADDISPQHNSISHAGGEYNPDCSCCWLGFAHSDRAHKPR